MVKEAKTSSAPLHVAGMILQSITNVRASARATRKSVAGFGVRQGQYLSVVCDLVEGGGCAALLVQIGRCGDAQDQGFQGHEGQFGGWEWEFGDGVEWGGGVGLFPEVEVNYDM